MEFHPSYARAVVRASGSPGMGPSTPPGPIPFLSNRESRTPGAEVSVQLPQSGAPRLINLERRAKFARVGLL
jgi:hypothetical protein